MKKESFNQFKKEAIYIGLLFLSFLIIFKIAFFEEKISVIFLNVLSLFWLFVLPGYSLMFYWNEKLDFLERFVIGIALSAAITGIASYYIGLIGLNIKYHTILLPLILILTGLFANYKK